MKIFFQEFKPNISIIESVLFESEGIELYIGIDGYIFKKKMENRFAKKSTVKYYTSYMIMKRYMTHKPMKSKLT